MSTQIAAANDLLWNYVAEARPALEAAFIRHLPSVPAAYGGRFNEALHYALFPGGKRLRPVLTLLGAELVGGRPADVLAAASAVEYVHTSSLIFDDLPCMDDAAERRGQSALHRRYGEGLSVLVALALLNTSYGLVFHAQEAQPGRAIRAHQELVACIGTSGMVTGQTVDLSSAVGEAVNHLAPDHHDAVRNLKTSALMRLSLLLGAILSGANDMQLTALARFAELVGEAYQISDDMLDLAEDAALAAHTRAATFALEQGASGAQLSVASMITDAKAALDQAFGRTRPAQLLCAFADYIAARED